MFRPPSKLPLVFAVVLALCAARPALGQASAYVPLDDNAYAYADALIARGHLQSLSQLERPYRVSDFRKAMAQDTAQGSSIVQRLYESIAQSIAKYDPKDAQPTTETAGPPSSKADDDALYVSITPYLLAIAQTPGVSNVMLAPDSTMRFRPGFGGIASVQMGSLVAYAQAYDDGRLKDDPYFTGQKNHWYVGRMEDAYVSEQFKYGELFLGRLARNWGPSQVGGLLLSNNAYTYDHLYLKLGVPAFHLSTIVTRLNDGYQADSAGGIDTARRYFSIHQLTLNLGHFEGAVSEAVIYGGKTENLRFNYINPIEPYILSEVLENAPGNILTGMDLAYRSSFGNFNVQGLLDDVAKDKCGLPCEKPNSYGYTFTAEGLPFIADQRLFASYTRLANLTYRNEEWYDSYTSESISLGRDYADYDEARIGMDVVAIPGAPLRLYLAYRRQGEGDYREPHPTVAEYPETAQFLQGIVEHITRVGLSGAGSITRYIQITGDVGADHSTNAGHIAGVNDNRIVGHIQVTIESPWRLAGKFHPDN